MVITRKAASPPLKPMEYARSDLSQIKSTLNTLAGEIKSVPTKRDLNACVIGRPALVPSGATWRGVRGVIVVVCCNTP